MTTVENQHARRKTLPATELAKLLGASIGPALRMLLEPGTFRQFPRLLHEGIDPIVHLLLQANNAALINRWLNKGTEVVFISSFPRSGNTWMRFMLCDVLLQIQGVETSTQLPVHPDNLIAEFGSNSITRRITRCPNWALNPPLAFVKAHASFSRLEQIFLGRGKYGTGGQAPFRDCRALYLYRSPEDALVSLYHMKLHDCYSRSRARHNIDEFCLTEVLGWVENITSYMRAADHGFPVLFISYEQMLEKPAIVLADLLRWLDVPHNGQTVERAVSNMRFCNLQAMEKQENSNPYPTDENALFFRRGRSGSGRSELQESTLREIRERTAALLADANRRQANQSPPVPSAAMAALNHSALKAPFGNGEATLDGTAKEPGIPSLLQGM